MPADSIIYFQLVSKSYDMRLFTDSIAQNPQNPGDHALQELLRTLRLPCSSERHTATASATLHSSTNTRIVNKIAPRSEIGTRK
jgi:hypothetical protein